MPVKADLIEAVILPTTMPCALYIRTETTGGHYQV